MIQLILGGARSGKSRRAEQVAGQLSLQKKLPVTYVATATALDLEMQQRIEHHQQQRPADWELAECPLALVELIQSSSEQQILLVDCLTLWLNNQLFHYPQQEFSLLFQQLAQSCQQTRAEVILVANEVGLGVVPMGQVSRQFVDEAGRLNQKIADVAHRVEFVVAGLPQLLKGQVLKEANL